MKAMTILEELTSRDGENSLTIPPFSAVSPWTAGKLSKKAGVVAITFGVGNEIQGMRVPCKQYRIARVVGQNRQVFSGWCPR